MSSGKFIRLSNALRQQCFSKNLPYLSHISDRVKGLKLFFLSPRLFGSTGFHASDFLAILGSLVQRARQFLGHISKRVKVEISPACVIPFQPGREVPWLSSANLFKERGAT